MNYKKFYTAINSIAPSKVELIALGYSDSYAGVISSKFTISPLPKSFSYNNEILALINNCNATDLDIRGVTFFEKISMMEKFIGFGKYDEDILCLTRGDYEIVLVDSINTDHVMIKCAKEASSFLDAMYLIADYTLKGIRPHIIQNDEEKKAIVSQAASAAGGKDYENFYKTIVGFRQ